MKLEVWGASDGRCPQCNTLGKFLDSKFITYSFMCVDKYPTARQELGIKNIPVMRLLNDDGSEVKRTIGFGEVNRKMVLDMVKESGQ